MKTKVIITVSGGVAEIQKAPKGVDVFIVDKDNIDNGDPYEYNGKTYTKSDDAIDSIKADYSGDSGDDKKHAIILVQGGVADVAESNVEVEIIDYDNEEEVAGDGSDIDKYGKYKDLVVPYNLAKLAKEKGFDKPCFGMWEEQEFKITNISFLKSQKEVGEVYGKDTILAPTYQQIVDWFEEKGIYLYAFKQGDVWHWKRDIGKSYDAFRGDFDTKYNALNDGIENTLNMLKDKASKAPKASDGLKLKEKLQHLIGKRIRLIEMPDDPDPIKPGEEGEVTGIDDAGQIQVKWDSGRTLSLIEGVDKYEVIEKAADGTGTTEDKAFYDFKNNLESALFKKYGLMLNDTGIDNDYIKSAMEHGESIESIVDNYGEKYELTPISATETAVEIKSPEKKEKRAENGYICVVKDRRNKELGRYRISYNDEKYADDLLQAIGVKLKPGDKKEIIEA